MAGTRAFSGDALPAPKTGLQRSAKVVKNRDDQLLSFVNDISGLGNFTLPDVAAGAGNNNKTILFGSGSSTSLSNLVRAGEDFNLAADGSSGEVLSTNGSGALSFVTNNATATPAVVNSSVTVAANTINIVDVTSGTITITLPASPTTATQLIYFLPGPTNWSTTNWTLGRNSTDIEGVAEDLTVDVNNPFAVYYSDATNGWRILGMAGGS